MTGIRALFFAQKPVGEAAWRYLQTQEDEDFEVVALCSNADADAVWWGTNEVHATRGDRRFVESMRRQPDELLATIRELDVNLLLLVQYPWILPPEVLAAVDYNILTCHNAPLPRYGGHNAVAHAILNGETEFGCTVHWMADQVDSGAIALETTFPLAPDETAFSLFGKCHHANLFLFDALVRKLKAGEPVPRRAGHGDGDVHVYPRTSLDGMRLIATAAPTEIDRKARAFYFPPFEPAHFLIDKRKLFVLPEGVPQLQTAPGAGRRLLDEQIASTAPLSLRLS